MLIRNLLYFTCFTFIVSPSLLADSFEEIPILMTNGIKRSKNTNIDITRDLNENIDSDLIRKNDILDNEIGNDFKESRENVSIQSEVDELTIIKSKELDWNLIDNRDYFKNDIKWTPLEKNDYPVIYQKNNHSIKKRLNRLHEYFFDFKFLKLGSAVSTSETLNLGEMRFNIGQVSPVLSGYAKGTGNQNYIGSIDYGIQDNFVFSIFYTDADDPLTKRINKLDTQPENRWSSYGSSLKWKFLKKPKYQVAIESSIENWLVQSGGCAGTKCSFNTSNIFNSGTSMVENNNLIGSISLPIGLKYFSNLDLTISPKFTFLPSSQSNKHGKGDFYGNNYGIGFGMAYKVINRLKSFSSYYLPLGDSKNSFDDNINFNKTSIYTLGANYSLDSRTSFQAFLSNGFGLSPATSVLSIPSSNELLYGFNIVYTPTNFDNYDILYNKRLSNGKFFKGLSVSNNTFIDSGNSQFNIMYDVDGSWNSRIERALSQRFIVDISAGVVDKGIGTKSIFKKYFAPGNTILRGGAKAILYSSDDENLFTSSFRGSFGRVLAEDKPGYFFGESINSYNFNPKVSFNINPKLGVSGSGDSIGVGTGLHWKVLNEIILISETNIPINNSENNVTFGVRYSPGESNKHIDLYSSNAFSFIDMGQLMKRDKNIVGVNIGILY